MSKYVDGFVVPVKREGIEQYRQLAQTCAEIWKEYGALACVECVAEDVKPGKLTSFPQSVQLKDDEIVVFAWIVYESREKRDEINKKVMEDERMKAMDPKTMPVDGMRMFWGGFETIVEL